ncbi:hypothetical protein DOTSEDRAFT_75289 [Dothistroma septosporum NZE10]|uniref:Uncharacterized protein n=1 Tax=Dothistroma septosporum (strain NZE10 / CBS 128990) TaxID=675120 RepID=M2Y2R0_DOTSN|nr:hypothetical protein DOTSEDRAFT_75289 [Dothistroma septosporum NZE10]
MTWLLGQQSTSSAASKKAQRSPAPAWLTYRAPEPAAAPCFSATVSTSSTTPAHTSGSLFEPFPATFSRLLSATAAANGLHTFPAGQDIASTTLPSISTLDLPLPGSSVDAWQDIRADGHSNQRHSDASASHTASGNNAARGLGRIRSYLTGPPVSAASDIISRSKSMVDLAASNRSAMERHRVESELAMRAEQLHDSLHHETVSMRARFDCLRVQARDDAQVSKVWPRVHEAKNEIQAAYTIDSLMLDDSSGCTIQHSSEVDQSFADLGEPMRSSFLDYGRGMCLLFGDGHDTADHLSRVHKALLYAQMAYEDCMKLSAGLVCPAETVPTTEHIDMTGSVENRDDLDMPSRSATAALIRGQRMTRSATMGRDATGIRVTKRKRKRKRPAKLNLTSAEVVEEKLKFEQQKHDPQWLEAVELKIKQSNLYHPPATSKHPKVDTESHLFANRYQGQHPSADSRRDKSKDDAATTVAQKAIQTDCHNVVARGPFVSMEQATSRASSGVESQRPRALIVRSTLSALRPVDAAELGKGKEKAPAS